MLQKQRRTFYPISDYIFPADYGVSMIQHSNPQNIWNFEKPTKDKILHLLRFFGSNSAQNLEIIQRGRFWSQEMLHLFIADL